MEDTIYLVQPNETLVEMRAQPYDSEPRLQALLAKYPDLLAGGQMNPENPRRWLLIAREMGIAWEEGGGDQLSLDHLFLDQEGIPTLVEVKRSSDTRIRREVIGQMLEYAANAVIYWPAERIQARFESRCEKAGIDPARELALLLGNMEGEESDTSHFWQQVHNNLLAGRIRMVFVADVIPFQLRRIVEFLNTQMSTAEVLAVEVKQYVGGGLQTLVPRVIGQTAQTEAKISPPRESKQWDETTFFVELSNRTGPAEVQVARGILDWAKVNMPNIRWGLGKQDGSFNLGITHQNHRHPLIGVWTNGYFELQFQYMKSHNSLNDTQRLSLLKRINATLSSSYPDEMIHLRPSPRLSMLIKPGVLDAFLKDLEWALAEMKIGLGMG